MSENYSTGLFALHLTTLIPTDIATIAAGGELTDGTDFTSFRLDVTDVDRIAVQGYVTGDAGGASGRIDFDLLGSLDGVLWDTGAVLTLNVEMYGTNKRVESSQFDVRGYRLLKLDTVENNDGSVAAKLLNLRWGKSYGHLPRG